MRYSLTLEIIVIYLNVNSAHINSHFLSLCFFFTCYYVLVQAFLNNAKYLFKKKQTVNFWIAE